jgi:DtxR family Mn-dependent transcriptional regulator
MTSSEAVSESMEDYLKAIFNVIAKQQVARPKDILKILKVSAPSVTGALHALAEREFIHYSPHDLITLTEKGERAARDVVRRHDVILNFFEKILLVDPKDAEEVACRMEHAISPNVMERFIRFVEFLDLCPRAGEKWISGFGYYCDQDGKLDNCETCISQTLEEVRKKKREGGAMKKDGVQLSELQPGSKGRVVRVSIPGDTGRRMVEMGVTSGSMIEVERIAPLGDPIDIKVKGYHLTLRKDEASGIEVIPE